MCLENKSLLYIYIRTIREYLGTVCLYLTYMFLVCLAQLSVWLSYSISLEPHIDFVVDCTHVIACYVTLICLNIEHSVISRIY